MYRCGWSPLEGFKFNATINKTFVNGNLVFENGKLIGTTMGKRLAFDIQ
jgi:dihydroorotase